MVSRIRRRGTIAPPTTAGICAMLPMATIPASGGLMTAVKCSMSNMPRFETENVAPVYSSGVSLRSRARPASARASVEICRSDFPSAWRMTGVMSPSSIATAMPRWTSCQYRM